MNPTETASALYVAMRTNDRVPFTPVDPATGWRVRELVHDRFIGDGDHVAGYKIGLSARELQASYGIDEPGWGFVFSSQLADDGSAVAPGGLALLAEAEIAVIIGEELDGAALSDADLTRSIDHVRLAIEVVGTRWSSPPAGSIGGWTADNGMAVRAVLGRREVDFSPGPVTISFDVAGRHVSADIVPPVLDNLRWLARDLAREGRSLAPGAVVLTGALGDALPVSAGETFTARADGYGSVSVHILANDA